MTHQTRAGIELIRLGDSDFVSANPEDDLRGKDVYDAEGQRIGSVGDLYIDRQEREVRFLEVGAGGFLGMGEKNFLVPVEAVVEVADDRVTIEAGRTEKMAGPAPFDTKVVPRPPATGARTTPRLRSATPRALPSASTPRYGTSTDRTSGRRVGSYGPYGR
jgi:sporulation protein YlmC with PRC-barrel domain